jgi:NAD-dependent deacetylase
MTTDDMPAADADTARLRNLILGADRIVFFTGAGASTESGIPDFRGPQGLWKTVKPTDFNDFIGSEEVRRNAWRARFTSRSSIDDAQPNSGHQAVASLIGMGKASQVITQNIDGLYQKAGVPDEQVIELHGNSQYCTCLDCGCRYEMTEVRAMFLPEEVPPVCSDCGGIIKTATISFGQSMPVAAMHAAEQATLAADLFIAMGSSLVVYPAASFPVLAKRNGAGLVIINYEPTDLDELCDIVIHKEIGATLAQVID